MLGVQHFHYSYVVNAAAVLVHLRPRWATSNNIAWVNTLIRDVNDPNKVGGWPRSEAKERACCNARDLVRFCYVLLRLMAEGVLWLFDPLRAKVLLRRCLCLCPLSYSLAVLVYAGLYPCGGS